MTHESWEIIRWTLCTPAYSLEDFQAMVQVHKPKESLVDALSWEGEGENLETKVLKLYRTEYQNRQFYEREPWGRARFPLCTELSAYGRKPPTAGERTRRKA